MSNSRSNGQYEVLSPWAEVDPILLRGISIRLTDLTGKKLGFFANGKQAARPIMTVLEEKLKERLPDTEIVWYVPLQRHGYSILQTESENKEVFEEWLNGVDTVIAAIGD